TPPDNAAPTATPEPDTTPEPDMTPAPTPTPAPAAPGGPVRVAGNAVVLQVTGLVDQETRQAFGDKLGEVMNKIGHGYRVRSTGGGDRGTYTITPISDVKQCADKLTSARVTRMEGRVIYVEMPPLSQAERRPAGADAVGVALFDLKSPLLPRRKNALGRL